MKSSGRNALGKGLSALIPPPRYAQNRDDYFMCSTDLVYPDPEQPRQHFDADALDELASSIKEKGVIQPLVVRKSEDHYILIAGERRLRASRRAGLKEVPVLVKDVASNEALELALIENIQREDLNAIEEALAYQRLLAQPDATQETVSKRLGKPRSTVANCVRLLRLDRHIQQHVIDGSVSAGHARALLSVSTDDERNELLARILDEGLSVRAAEFVVKQSKLDAKPPRQSPKVGPSPLQPYCDAIATDLTGRLNTRVSIAARARKGKIVISFDDLDDLRRLHALLGGNQMAELEKNLSDAI